VVRSGIYGRAHLQRKRLIMAKKAKKAKKTKKTRKKK
jgi:hypothetical protein